MKELIIFAKAPRAGEVKTRLARDLGRDEACAVYRRLLSILSESLAALPQVQVCYSPSDGASDLQGLFPGHWSFAPQAEGDLGARMAHALADSHARGNQRSVIIGADCPDVQVGDIHDAWEALEQAEVVFGPANDGGYWLVGARVHPPKLFSGIEWGTASVLERNLARCRELELSVKLLRTLGDIDTMDDWDAFLRRQGRE